MKTPKLLLASAFVAVAFSATSFALPPSKGGPATTVKHSGTTGKVCIEASMANCRQEVKTVRGNLTGKGTLDRPQSITVNQDGKPCMTTKKVG